MFLWNPFVSAGSEVQRRRNTAATQHAQEGHIIAGAKLFPSNIGFLLSGAKAIRSSAAKPSPDTATSATVCNWLPAQCY